MSESLVKLAVAKCGKAKEITEISQSLGAGTYKVDCIVRVFGTVNKGEDFESVVHMKVPHWKLIATCLNKLNGVTVDAIVREALDISDEQEEVIKERVEAAIDTIKGTTKSTVSGKLTTALQMDIVSGKIPAQAYPVTTAEPVETKKV